MSLDWLEGESDKRYWQLKELWRVADLRPCVRLGGGRRWVRARRWGIVDEDLAGEEPQKTDLADWRLLCATRWREWLDSWRGRYDYRHWRGEVSRPHRAVLHPALIPVSSADGSLLEWAAIARHPNSLDPEGHADSAICLLSAKSFYEDSSGRKGCRLKYG